MKLQEENLVILMVSTEEKIWDKEMPLSINHTLTPLNLIHDMKPQDINLVTLRELTEEKILAEEMLLGTNHTSITINSSLLKSATKLILDIKTQDSF